MTAPGRQTLAEPRLAPAARPRRQSPAENAEYCRAVGSAPVTTVDDCGHAPCVRNEGPRDLDDPGNADPLAGLSPRRRRFVLVVAAGNSYAEAARLAGYKHRSARKAGSKLMATPEVRDAVAAIMGATELGCLDPAAVARHIESEAFGLDSPPAVRVKALALLARITGLDDGAEPWVVDFDPRTIVWSVESIADDEGQPGWVRLRALDLLAKMGALVAAAE